MFPLGKPVAVLACVAAVSGAMVLSRSRPAKADLDVWVYAADEAQTFGDPALVDSFQRQTGKSFQIELLSQRALDGRLMSLFMADDQNAAVPDLVEIDLGSVGKFFRPPTQDIGLLPLNRFLADSGELDRLTSSRLVPWTRHGVIYGIPRDVHPVTLVYRKDLFELAGVDLESAGTWAEFQEAGLRFEKYWAEHGYPGRRAIELYTTQSEELLVMLLQRHINLINDDGEIELGRPQVAKTVAFYTQMAAGARAVAADTIPGTPFGYRDLAEGNVCAMLMPDWRVVYLEEFAPELAGKVRMMALPKFDAGDAPTSTWGGTMIGIPAGCKDPEASWKLLRTLCLTPEAVQTRRKYTDIIPPQTEFWGQKWQPDPYFGGQVVDGLYASLAGEIPRRTMTPFSITAQSALSLVLNKAVGYAQIHGADGLEAACSGWLNDAAGELQEWMGQGEIDP